MRYAPLAALLLLACQQGSDCGAAPPGSGVTLTAGDLTATFAGNDHSPCTISGVQSLYHAAEPDFDAFDPTAPGTGGGLNFEHVIAVGYDDLRNEVTPRFGPMPLTVLDDRTVRLDRSPSDSPWGVGATITYQIEPPHYLDMRFRCEVTRPEEFEPGGVVLFFASYMHEVVDPALHFLADDAGRDVWVRGVGDDPSAHPDWNTGGNWRGVGSEPLPYPVGSAAALNLWAHDAPLISRPFYYGLMDRGMVYAILFDRLHTPSDEVRFTVFRWKLPVPRPAWDWSYALRDPRAACGFDARVVFKPFVSAADIEDEYLRWME